MYGELADASEALVAYAGLRVDRGRGELVYGERRVALTPTELRLATRLVQARGKPVSREDLLVVAWSDETFVDDNTLTVNIARLRRKLGELGLAEAPGGPAQPEAVRLRMRETARAERGCISLRTAGEPSHPMRYRRFAG